MPRADPIVRARRVRLADDDFPNEKRERVAEYIDERWNEEGGLQLTDVAESTETSRQHVKNTLDAHFEIAEEEQPEGNHEEINDRTIQMLFQAYRMGYRDAIQDSERRDLRDGFNSLLREQDGNGS